MDIVEVLSVHFNDCMWEIDDNQYETLIWNENNTRTKPTLEQLQELWDSRAYIKLRKQRKFLLTESDWTIFPDSPLTEEKKEEWRVYRQALRDLPATSSPTLDEKEELTNITWPEAPTP